MATIQLISKAITALLNILILRRASRKDYYVHLLYLEAPSVFAASNPLLLLLTMLYTIKVTPLWWPHILVYYVALFIDALILKDSLSIAIGDISRYIMMLVLAPLGIEAFVVARCVGVLLSTISSLFTGTPPKSIDEQKKDKKGILAAISENAILRYFLEFEDQIMYATISHYGSIFMGSVALMPVVNRIISAVAACLIFIAPFYIDSAMRLVLGQIKEENSLPLLLSWYSAVIGLTLVHQGDSYWRLPLQFLALAIKPSSLSLVMSQFIILVLTMNIQISIIPTILCIASIGLGIWSKVYVEDDIKRLLLCIVNGMVVVSVMGFSGLVEGLRDLIKMWKDRKLSRRHDKLSTKED